MSIVYAYILYIFSFMRWARRRCGGHWERVMIHGYDSDDWSSWTQVREHKEHPYASLAHKDDEIQCEEWGGGKT